MTSFAVLEITDGTDAGTVNLLNIGNGLHLNDWNRAVIQPKRGGTFQSSSLAPSRRLVNAVDATGFETLELKINGSNQDALITELQNFFRLLLKARDYWLSDWQDVPVYIRARAACETNEQFAHILNWTIEELDNPYAQPFFSASLVATMDEITLVLERNHWLANAPGEGECVDASNQSSWVYDGEWELLDNTLGAAGGFGSALIQAITGSIFAGATNVGNVAEIYKSVDDGDTWALSKAFAAASGYPKDFTQKPNGNILVSLGLVDEVHQTTNDGATWVLLGAPGSTGLSGLLAISNDVVLAGRSIIGSAFISRSIDGGATWGDVLTISEDVGSAFYFTQISDGTIFAALSAQSPSSRAKRLYKSTDDGLTWTVALNPTVPIRGRAAVTNKGFMRVVQTTSGRLLTIEWAEDILISDDSGVTWFKGQNLVNDVGFTDFACQKGIISLSNGISYIIPDVIDEIAISRDNGNTWELATNIVANQQPDEVRADMIETTTGRMIYTAKDDTGTNQGSAIARNFKFATLGTIQSCTKNAYVSNKTNVANFTNILIEDNSGATFTEIFPISVQTDLYPAAMDTDDAIYFGSDIAVVDSGVFSSVVFNISRAYELTAGTPTITWEYWSGAWVALTVQDNTENLTALGINSVHFIQPIDWSTTSLTITATAEVVTAFWVRARNPTAAGAIAIVPQQDAENIYSITNGSIEIPATGILGDVPALSRIEFLNESDKDGRGGSGPDLWDNRVIVGLRSIGRSKNDGGNFQAYLNITDEQNPVGVTVTLGTDTAFGNDPRTPTGRRTTYTALAVPDAMADRATVTFSSPIARDFYGEFHIFLRARRTSGAITDFNVQLVVSTGSGGIQFTTESKQLQTTTDWELLDFGQIKIPVSGSLKSSDLGDETKIIIQASAASITTSLYLHDLILIPVDEWAGDFVDRRNQNESIIGREGNRPRLLDIDSVTDPKNRIQSLVRQEGSERIVSVYNPITNGEAILQANAQQRLWFLTAKTSATGTSFSWISEPWVAHSIQITHNARYLSLRGDR